MKKLSLFFAAILFSTLMASANATIIDFENPLGTNFSISQSFSGFDFDFDAGGWMTTSNPACCTKTINTNGTKVLMFAGGKSGPSGSVTMTEDLLSLFSIFAFDGASNDVGAGENVDVIGTFADLSTITTTFNLTNAFTTFNLVGYDNLVSLEFLQISTGDFFNTSGVVVDNLNLEGAVPAPATVALFGLGLAGLGFARRKKA